MSPRASTSLGCTSTENLPATAANSAGSSTGTANSGGGAPYSTVCEGVMGTDGAAVTAAGGAGGAGKLSGGMLAYGGAAAENNAWCHSTNCVRDSDASPAP